MELFWYVACVKASSERKAQERLQAQGVETFLPVQREARQWSDRVRMVDRLLLPGMVFVHASNEQRLMSLEANPYVLRYLSVRGTYKPAVIPDDQMESFMQMVTGSGRSVELSQTPIAPGDTVRVVAGPLAGRVCEVVALRGRHFALARLGLLGTACVELRMDEIEKTTNINKGQ